MPNALTPRCPALVLCALLVAPFFVARAQNEPGKYIGPGSCAATSCHGSVKPIAGSRILQNEYSTWILKDKHSRAYQALRSKLGQQMGTILHLKKNPEEDQKCLDCHALSPPDHVRGRPFPTNEGVSCESCHGPAQGWLGQHTAK